MLSWVCKGPWAKKSHIVSAAWVPVVLDAWMEVGRQNDDPEPSPPVIAFHSTSCAIAPVEYYGVAAGYVSPAVANDALYMPFSTSPAVVVQHSLRLPLWRTHRGRRHLAETAAHWAGAKISQPCSRPTTGDFMATRAVRPLPYVLVRVFTSGRLPVGLRPPQWARLVCVDSRDIRPPWGQALPIKSEEGFVSKLYLFQIVYVFLCS